MGSGFKKKKKQMQALQNQLMQAQEEMKTKEVTGTSGGNLVSVTLNGEFEMLNITLKPESIDPDDIDGLQDLIKSAYNSAKDQLGQSEADMMPPSLMDFMPS